MTEQFQNRHVTDIEYGSLAGAMGHAVYIVVLKISTINLAFPQRICLILNHVC